MSRVRRTVRRHARLLFAATLTVTGAAPALGAPSADDGEPGVVWTQTWQEDRPGPIECGGGGWVVSTYHLHWAQSWVVDEDGTLVQVGDPQVLWDDWTSEVVDVQPEGAPPCPGPVTPPPGPVTPPPGPVTPAPTPAPVAARAAPTVVYDGVAHVPRGELG